MCDCAATVGKFEGLHRGHRALIEKVVSHAQAEGLPSAVITFDPHPKQALYDSAYVTLFTMPERALILRDMGVDRVIVCPFDETFAQLSPEAFSALLFNDFRCRFLAVGQGFRFGRDREGHVGLLQAVGALYEAQVMVMAHLVDGSNKIGSSGIRDLIDRASLEDAARLLGFPFFIMGKVEQGNKIGRTLGFPTVNIRPDAHKRLPPDGVYITQTRYKGKKYRSVTNIGLKPTLGFPAKRTVESYLFDFNQNIYGAEILTEFFTFLRPEIKFAHINDLREQIKKDRERARAADLPKF